MDTLVTFRTYFRQSARREDGFALIEVVISAMLVALIVVALLTGLDAAGRTTADERYHNQAAVLAAQSQEALRSDPASSLDTIQGNPHIYTQTIGGETFTIAQEVLFVNGSNGKVGCSAAGGSEAKQSGNYLQITSSVSWAQLGKRKQVIQSSVITPPDGSSLEVDITNGATTPLPVSGVTVIANGVQTTTGTAGCVLYASIPSTTVSLEAFQLGYVTENGEYKVKVKEVSIAPNLTTHYEITLAPGGSITAEFTNKGKPATGDTFVAFSTRLPTPEYELGSTKITALTNAEYEPLAGEYAAKAQTYVSAGEYPNGNLFPFEKSTWSVYAGDCLANNASTVSKGVVTNKSVTVLEKATVKVTVPMALLGLNLYTGESPAKKGELETKEQFPVKITNESCKASVAVNASKSVYVHEQNVKSGHLERSYQPFGKFGLCLFNAKTKETYTIAYETKSESELAENIYLTAKSSEGGVTENGVTVRSKQSTC